MDGQEIQDTWNECVQETEDTIACIRLYTKETEKRIAEELKKRINNNEEYMTMEAKRAMVLIKGWIDEVCSVKGANEEDKQ